MHAVARWFRTGPLVLLVVLSLPDLFSPPISPTISRQTQTYAQTVHLVASGFAPAGMAIDIDGARPFHLAYEFPLYEAGVGLLFLGLGPSFFWGKLVSLAATAVGLWVFVDLVRREWGADVSAWAALFAASSPITLLLSAAFQPDALALALTAIAMATLFAWRRARSLGRWTGFLLVLLAAALAKFVVLVPFVPLVVFVVLRRDGRWRVPGGIESLAVLGLFVAPFLLWTAYRSTITDPRALAGEAQMFLVGDPRRFLHASFYLKPAFILGAMTMCGAGAALAVVGLSCLDAVGLALLLGVPLYYVLIPTAADQTYYAWPLVPGLAVAMGLGARRVTGSSRSPWRTVTIVAAWLAGFAIAAPYTLRHDRVTLDAATAARSASQPDDLLFVMNMHDRGVGVGGLNPSIVTLAQRRGWNVRFDSSDAETLRAQIEARRREGARWVVATWFTPDLEPWFAGLLPGSFSRCPRFEGTPIDGRAIVERLALRYPPTVREGNFAVLKLE